MTKWTLIAACVAIAVGGCATQPTAPIVTDTYCLSAKKRTWSVHDTAETIRDAEAWNKAIDLRCGVRRGGA